MFTITDFDSKEKVVENIGTINEFGRSTQLRIYDLLTGVYSRILPQTDGRYVLTESGISPKGFLNELYGITEDLDIDDDSMELYEQVLNQIDKLSLTSDEVDMLLKNGFLHTIRRKNPQNSSINGFKETLAAERLAYEIEQNGSIAYQNVLDEINRRLSTDKVPDDERKILVALKNVYENDFFRQGRENSTILQEQQKTNDETHSAEQITDDLLEIGKSADKEKALHQLIETKEKSQKIIYDILGVGSISKEALIYCIENDAITLQEVLDIIKKDDDVRQVALKRLSEMSQEEIKFYGYEHILDDIRKGQDSKEESK